MNILKFGGTSVGNVSNINKVITIAEKYSKDNSAIIVVSAIGGITDKLIRSGLLAAEKDSTYKNLYNEIEDTHLATAKGLLIENPDTLLKLDTYLKDIRQLLDGIFMINEFSQSTIDKLTAFGELCSSLLVSEAMRVKNIDVGLKDARELISIQKKGLKVDVDYSLTTKQITTFFKEHTAAVTVVPGYIASFTDGTITTLGRGGSDFTAAIIASALDAETLEIWTDVSGMFTANPRLVKQAKPIASISYQEAMELSHFGAKVLYPPTIAPVMSKRIPIQIKNTFDQTAAGTQIAFESGQRELGITGLSNIDAIALLTLEGNGMVGIPGFSKRLFEVLSKETINIIFITQASSEHSICIGILESDAKLAKAAVDIEFENEISLNKLKPILVEENLSIIALVGDQMKSHQGISGRMFSALGRNNVNIRAIAQGASEKNISAVIDSKDVKKALNVLHENFFEDQLKQLNLFITGVGNVGEKLLQQIAAQKDFLKERLRVNLRIVGLSNSRTMVLDDGGIALKSWRERLAEGDKASLESFNKIAVAMNLRNSIFVDITANEAVANSYDKYLRNSIAVVACNKIACASDYDSYKKLKTLSRDYNAPFLFETNVGAGLPIVDTLNNLMASGDKIHKIEAVLSGSLNFIFNNFKSGNNFHDVVKQAQTEGYTEPDPRIDLSGVDVARKILILARESGLKMNLEDITNMPFLTENNLNSKSVEDFYETLKTDAGHFEALVSKAEAKGNRLKYVASLEDGKASVGLQEIPQGHPFYNLEGKDNIVLFHTERYSDQPLIVKGAGAGGDVTASGLFADIIRLRGN